MLKGFTVPLLIKEDTIPSPVSTIPSIKEDTIPSWVFTIRSHNQLAGIMIGIYDSELIQEDPLLFKEDRIPLSVFLKRLQLQY